MKTNFFYFLITFLLSGVLQTFGQQVCGYVEDAESGERLPYANIIAPDHKSGVTSNNFGYFSIKLNNGKNQLLISYTGYEDVSLTIQSFKDTCLIVKMVTKNLLEEIQIVGRKKNDFSATQIGRIEIPIKQLQAVPALFGEPDLMKVLQLLPGIQSTKAGFSSLVVRGGKPDQNLILLDGVSVYNMSHLYGLYSVINENAIQSVNVIKGNYPARFGGRLSSLVDITLREGNKNKIKGEIGIGTVGGKFVLDGPIFDEKTTFCISGRRTLLDIFWQPYLVYKNKATNGYFFGDLNAKISRKISEADKLFFSFYYGKDKNYQSQWGEKATIGETDFDLSSKEGYKWGNYTFSMRWNHLFSENLFFNLTAIGSDFYLGNYNIRTFKNKQTGKSYNDDVVYSSGIRDLGFKTDFDYYSIKNHQIKFGSLLVNHQFNPGITVVVTEDIFNTIPSSSSSVGSGKNDLLESSLYVEDEMQLLPYLRLGIGIRSTFLKSNEKSFFMIEPRLSASVRLKDEISVKSAYSENSQFLHLLRSSLLELPTDLWIPASKTLLPEKSRQWSLGTEIGISGGLKLTLEGYYKEMINIVEYQEGSSLFSVKRGWEEKIEKGRGWAYGTELLLQKTNGKTTGWVGYTLSWAFNQFKNLNNGIAFPSSWDRRHDFVVTVHHHFNEKWDVGTNWIFNTGSPFTVPIYRTKVLIIDFPVYHYMPDVEISGARNSMRLPDYHRLDLSLNYHKQSVKHKGRTHHYSLSIYNAYNRKNVYYKGYISGRPTEASLFPILPSISYKLSF